MKTEKSQYTTPEILELELNGYMGEEGNHNYDQVEEPNSEEEL